MSLVWRGGCDRVAHVRKIADTSAVSVSRLSPGRSAFMVLPKTPRRIGIGSAAPCPRARASSDFSQCGCEHRAAQVGSSQSTSNARTQLHGSTVLICASHVTVQQCTLVLLEQTGIALYLSTKSSFGRCHHLEENAAKATITPMPTTAQAASSCACRLIGFHGSEHCKRNGHNKASANRTALW